MPAPDYTRFLLEPNNGERAPREPLPDPRAGELNPLARKLDAVTQRALDKLDELLALPVDTQDGNLLRAQTAAANTVLHTQTRVDEARLRARAQTDILPKIIEMMKAEEENLKQIEQKGYEDG
jgi:hypothetical protein